MNSFLKDGRSIIILLSSFIFAAGIYWIVPYKEIELLSRPFIIKFSLGALILAVTGAIIKKGQWMTVTALVTVGFILAIVFRALYDMLVIDDSSHNLLLIELVVVIGLTLPPALIGAFATDKIVKG